MSSTKKAPLVRSLIVTVAVLSVTGLAMAQSGKSEEKTDKNKESEAPVKIVEYGDYECPACGYYHSMVKKLKSEMGDKIEVTFHHFPLQQHQYAALAARAAEAARNQGKFWEMHDKLYSNQNEWSQGNATNVITNYARSIGLDIKQFKMDLNSRKTQRKVMKDKKQGINQGINSTPTFFVNGKMIDTPRTYKQFKSEVKNAMASEQ